MKFFQNVKRIVSKSDELYFERYAIFEIENFAALYIHKIYRADKDKHLHTHPWNFASVILKGSYIEESDDGFYQKVPGTFSFAGRHFCHKISQIVSGPVISLFFVYGKYKPWYYSLGKIESVEYRKLKNENNLPDVVPNQYTKE
jgi:hypothetical protein